MTFVLIHGSFGSPSDAWFPWLKAELEAMGHEVMALQFPVDRWEDVTQKNATQYQPTQSLSSWMNVFEAVLPKLAKRNDLCFVGHSMGTLFTLHVVARYSLMIRKAFFVAPFLYPATEEELRDPSVALIDKANTTFYKNDFDFDFLRKHIIQSTVLMSDNDPYIPEWEAREFAEKLSSKIVKLHGLGHMGIESHMTKFPELLEKILE